MFKLGPISHFLSPVSCDSVRCYNVSGVNGEQVCYIVLSVSLSYTGHWKFNVAPHGKKLSEDLKKIIVALHKDGVGYKKIAKTLKLSCSTVAKTIQRFNRTGSTQNRPRHGPPKKLSARAQRHIQRLCLGNRRMSAASIAAEVEGVGRAACQCSDHTPHTESNWSAWLSSRRKPLLKMMHKKARKQFAEDKQTNDMDYWNHVLWWWDQDKLVWFRWCQACVAATRWGVQRQVCLAYSQAWWWECRGLGLHECCRLWGATVHLRKPWMPTCTLTYWSRAWSPPFGDRAAGQYFNMITTTALLK